MIVLTAFNGVSSISYRCLGVLKFLESYFLADSVLLEGRDQERQALNWLGELDLVVLAVEKTD